MNKTQLLRAAINDRINQSDVLDTYRDLLSEYEWAPINEVEILEFLAEATEDEIVDWAESLISRAEDEQVSYDEAYLMLDADPTAWEADFGFWQRPSYSEPV